MGDSFEEVNILKDFSEEKGKKLYNKKSLMIYDEDESCQIELAKAM